LHLIDTFDCGGAQQLLVELAKATPQELYPTSVAVIQPLDDLADRLENLGVPVYRLGRRRPSITHPLQFLRYLSGTLLDVVRLCRRHNVAILHCHLSDAESIGILAARIARVPRVLDTVHTPLILPKRHPFDPRNWMRSRFTPLVLNMADWIIAVSRETYEVLERMGVAPSKLRVVENGVATPSPVALPDPFLRASLGLEPGQPVLACVARHTTQKGQPYLVRAMPAVLERHPRAKLLLLGDGEQRSELIDEIRSLGLSGNVSLLGVRPDVREILAQTDIFILPSLWEGTSLALLEAMAAAKPIVATDIEGNRTILASESNCLLVPPADSGALARALIRLLNDPGLGETLGRQARLDMEATHGISVMFAAYEALWNASLSANRCAP
jgi:glycosyltransferase involved in cell wall biosynthesis